MQVHRKNLHAHRCGCIGVAPDGQPPALEAVEGALCEGQQQHEGGQDVQGAPRPCICPVCLPVNLTNIPAFRLQNPNGAMVVRFV